MYATPPSGEITMTSFVVGQFNLFLSVTMYPRQKVTMGRYQEVIVALSEFVIKSRLKRPLGEESR